jgi:hypothetical protein
MRIKPFDSKEINVGKDMIDQIVKVQIKKDGDGHNFIIPNELVKEFSVAMEKGYETDDFSDAEKFLKYSTGGGDNEYQLYILESDLKKLTGE